MNGTLEVSNSTRKFLIPKPVPLCCAVLCCAVLRCAVLCCAVLCCAALRCVLCRAVPLRCAVLLWRTTPVMAAPAALAASCDWSYLSSKPVNVSTYLMELNTCASHDHQNHGVKTDPVACCSALTNTQHRNRRVPGVLEYPDPLRGGFFKRGRDIGLRMGIRELLHAIQPRNPCRRRAGDQGTGKSRWQQQQC